MSVCLMPRKIQLIQLPVVSVLPFDCDMPPKKLYQLQSYSQNRIMDWYVKVLVGNTQDRYPLAHIFHQGNATIRSV